MELRRYEFAPPVEGDMDEMDLHVGCVMAPGDKELRVAVYVQPSDGKVTDLKYGTVLVDWIDVLEIINGLLDQAKRAFGEPPERPASEQAEAIAQIIYALQRQAKALDAQAEKLVKRRNYLAEFPAEDADRMREAITIMQLLLERNGYPRVASA